MRNPRMISMETANRQRNGAVPTLQSQATTLSNNRNNAGGDDIDIQILQQKKQQAEIKRSVFHYQLTDMILCLRLHQR